MVIASIGKNAGAVTTASVIAIKRNTDMTIIGIDPGEKGGIAVCSDSILMEAYNMPESYTEIYDFLKGLKDKYYPLHVVLEDVGHGIPGQSSKATAIFARHNGHLEMALYALGIPSEKVTPQKWQKEYSNTLGTSKGKTKTEWKNKLKSEAKRRFPTIAITLNTADAVLIAEYGRRNLKCL